jgi:integrase
VELQDAMDLNYLTGQRPADVLKMRLADIRDGALEVQQNKTNKKLRILLDDAQGARTALGQLVDRIKNRERKVSSLYLVATPA